MVAEVIINSVAKELNKTFDYIIPKALAQDVKIGARVFVPFGKTKTPKIEEGFVINIKNSSSFANKEIIKVEDIILTEDNISLAKLMARRYFCNISDCIKLMLPPGNASKNVEKRVKEKTGNFVYLKRDIDEIEFLIETEKIKSEKHIKILRFLEENDGVYISDLEVILDISRAIIKTLEKNGHIEIIEEKIERNPFTRRKINPDKPLKLTAEQQTAYKKIDCNSFGEYLIYGITGSGKTEIYLQLIENILKEGKTAMVLVPEISLTPQMVDRFSNRFGDVIAILHSRLSIGERFDEWQKIKIR